MPFPVDEKWIRAAERELGLDLPNSYRNRLKQDYGGDLEAAGDLLLFLVDEVSRTVFDSRVWLWDHETRQIEPIADFAELAPLEAVD